MHIVKNQRGIEVIYQDYTLRNCWGHIDGGNYFTERDEEKGQIFHFFGNALGIQLELLEYLENKYPRGQIKVYVINFEKENFYAICPTKDFRRLSLQWERETGKPAIYNYDKMDYKKYGKQIRLPINYFVRVYPHQKTKQRILEVFM